MVMQAKTLTAQAQNSSSASKLQHKSMDRTKNNRTLPAMGRNVVDELLLA
jgi:hypothetical protein